MNKVPKVVLFLTPGAGLTSSPVDLGHTGQHSPSGVYISVGLNLVVWLVVVPRHLCLRNYAKHTQTI